MSRKYYDLHIHSCLSPCGDNDMTPANIAGMAALKGLDIVALTDHNSSKNCPAFFKACAELGITPVAGMELTTAEDIHIICIFGELREAMAFDEYVGTRRIRIKNREDIFGEQLITDERDNVIGREEDLLINATDMPLEEACEKAREMGAFCYPAHIDREANGIIAVLGMLPEYPEFTAFEFNDGANEAEYLKTHLASKRGAKVIISSDAHYLWNINERDNFFELDDSDISDEGELRRKLFEYLKK